MKKLCVLSLAILACMGQSFAQEASKVSLEEVVVDESLLTIQDPVLARDYVNVNGWNHWFIGVMGGGSAFIGNPSGCGDLTDRLEPMVNAHIGKWITPHAGIRVGYQGFSFKGCNPLAPKGPLERSRYQAYHADFMYNLAGGGLRKFDGIARWEVAPYVGLGFARGRDYMEKANYPFIAAYGVYARLRVSQHLHILGELGGLSSFSHFDAVGSMAKFQDHMFSGSLGIGITLGNPKWKRAVDASPYINQTSELIETVKKLQSQNEAYASQHSNDIRIASELKKILEIEGLLDKYGYVLEEGNERGNEYKGLQSLLARMKAQESMGKEGKKDDRRIAGTNVQQNIIIESDEAGVPNIPIYFFFKLGKAELTDDSQLVNLDELAKAAINYNLKLKVIGAADLATGTTEINERLSRERTGFIAKELQKRGVEIGDIQGESVGGVKEYSKPEQNRYTKVAIYLE